MTSRPRQQKAFAGAAQARGAALRAGMTTKQLADFQARATAKASGVACNASGLVTAAARVRTGFAGYARLQKMSYPGDTAGWAADRAKSIRLNTWGLVQDTVFGRDVLSFGIALGSTQAPSLTALASFADGATPYSARIVARDPSRTADAYLDRRKVVPGGRLPLPASLPPASATESFNAQTRSAAPQDLLAASHSWAGCSASRPRPPMPWPNWTRARPWRSISCSPAATETVCGAYIEVGDFAAGRAFLRAVEP